MSHLHKVKASAILHQIAIFVQMHAMRAHIFEFLFESIFCALHNSPNAKVMTRQ